MYYYVESLAYVFSFQEAGHDRGNFILSMSFSFQKMSPVIVLFLKWTVREKKKKIDIKRLLTSKYLLLILIMLSKSCLVLM